MHTVARRHPTHSAARRAALILTLLAPVALPSALSAQQPVAPPVNSEAGGIEIQGPPPPAPPAVISRDAAGNATVRAVRVDGPMRMDGVLDEPFYEATPAISDFIQAVPDAGGAPSERTDAWVGFDDDNVYVAARIWNSRPESEWVANEMRRDSGANRTNDQFGVFLDTFYDRRNAIGIYVNPLGGFSDFQITNEGNINFDWNPVMQVRTGRFDGGWTAEIAIPFKSIRYRAGREQVWGLQLRRSIIPLNEWEYLTPLPLSAVRDGSFGNMRVSSYGTLVGVEAPPPSMNLEIKPYGISGLKTDMTVDPTVSNDPFADAGLDVKYGISENLTADLTFNTDFAQVEVDEQQVNLSRFSLFFPEKREFFLESRGIFDFGRGGGFNGPGGGGGGSTPTLFYSRRIGLQSGQTVPILAGGRVTGKVGAFDVGALSIQTDRERSVDAESTNFTVLRLRRDILARSSIGVLFENRSKSTVADGSNQAYGVDASFSFLGDASVVASYARTHTEGLTGNDKTYQGRLQWAGDVWGASVSHLLVGDDFNPEIGFVRRKGFRDTSLSARFSPRPASISSIRQLRFQADLGYLTNDRAGYVESRDRGGSFGIDFENGDSFGLSFTDSYENLVDPAHISGATIPVGRYPFRDVQASYTFGPQRRVRGGISLDRGSYYSGTRTSLSVGRGGRFNILPQLSLEPSLDFNWIDFPDIQETKGQFNQHVARLRATYGFTPRMFVSGLVQYNSGSDTFSANVRLRWEWAPGSELFIVYTEDRNTDPLTDRWSELTTRGLVIKVNRLFRP